MTSCKLCKSSWCLLGVLWCKVWVCPVREGAPRMAHAGLMHVPTRTSYKPQRKTKDSLPA